MKTVAIAAILAAAVPGATHAQVGATTPEPPELTEEAKSFLEETAEIRETWRVNDHLIGVALEIGPQQGMVVFADASGRYLISGAAIDTQTGNNVAELAMQEHFPEPGPEEMYAEAAGTNWIATSKGAEAGGPIYIVADTQCGYCHEVAKTIAESGIQREIRWILVGFLGPKSTNQAAGLLAAPDEQAGEGLMSILTGQADGVPEQIPEAAGQALEANHRWAQKWRINGTPLLLVPHNGEVHRVNGLPGRRLWEIIAP